VLTNVPVEDVEARLRCTRGEARLIAVGAIAADPLPYSRLPPSSSIARKGKLFGLSCVVGRTESLFRCTV